ncbi:MAG: L-threonylcarbamoyladenylate synthase [Flavobacteriales bacterium]|jgi:tRNA threonylcarbamoyl adenosine modification protein (Sua5/YciO/YrdC/YwlC family)|nr:L-threonylcarbamoyladenylate synthase [Flavobacteriales bacterium]
MLLAIHPQNPEPRKIRQVVEQLRGGGVVVIPTDTVYAFVCSAEHARAIERVTKLKGARPGKADLSLICKDLGQLAQYARQVDTPAFRLMKKALPGPYTFIVPASNEIPRLFKNNKRTVGIRVPDHPIPLAIVEELGHALAVASVRDEDAILEHTSDAGLIHERTGHLVEVVVDGGAGGLDGSTVIDLSGDAGPVVLRQGKGPVEGLLD